MDQTSESQRSMPRSDRSSGSSARARSCAWATRRTCRSRRSRPGALSLDLALGIGGVPRGRIVELYGPESSGKTTLCYHIIAEAQKAGGTCAFIDAEHAMDPIYASPHRRERRRAARLAARQRRAGARDRRDARPLRRARHRRDRLGRGARAEGRDRGRDGRQLRRPAGPADEPGDAQARRHAQPDGHDLPLHEPDPREDRRHVRLARDPARRSRAQVLRVGAHRHPPHRDAQGRQRRLRQPRARQGRQEQGRAAVPPGRVRRHLRRRHLLGGQRPRRRHRAERRSRRAGSFLSFGETRLGQGRERAKAFLREHPDILQAILDKIQEGLEGVVVPGATLPAPGMAIGEIPPSAEVEAAGADGVVDEPRPRTASRRRSDTASDRAQMAHDEPREAAMRRAGTALARRARSEAELTRALAPVAPPEVVDGVLDDLRALGYVDDTALACALAERRLASGWGALRVRADLERLEIEGETARAGDRGRGGRRAAAAERLLGSRPRVRRGATRGASLLARRASARTSLGGAARPRPR